MAFDIQAARKSGYSDDEILQHLTQSRKFDIQSAKSSGYSNDELITYLSNTPPPKPPVSTAKKVGMGIGEGLAQASQSGIGAVKSVASTVNNIAGFGQKALGALTKPVFNLFGQKKPEVSSLPTKVTNPTSAQLPGFVGGQVGQAFALPGVKTASLGAKMIGEGLIGAGAAKSQGASNKTAAAAGAISTVIPGAGALVQKVKGPVSKFLSFTSGAGSKAIQRGIENPVLQKAAIAAAKPRGGLDVLENIQGATKNFRKNLSAGYDTGRQALTQQFPAPAMKLPPKDVQSLFRLADENGLDLPTMKNLNNLTVDEGLNLYKASNELLQRPALRAGPDGALLRSFSKTVRETLVKSFGGKGGEVDNFLAEYSRKKEILDGVNSLVTAYKANNPVAQRTALNRLKTSFLEGEDSYYEALKAFQDETGLPILDAVSGLQFAQPLNKNMSAIMRDTAGLGFVRKLISVTGLTTPKVVASYGRTLGKVGSPGAAKRVNRVLPLVRVLNPANRDTSQTDR